MNVAAFLALFIFGLSLLVWAVAWRPSREERLKPYDHEKEGL